MPHCILCSWSIGLLQPVTAPSEDIKHKAPPPPTPPLPGLPPKSREILNILQKKTCLRSSHVLVSPVIYLVCGEPNFCGSLQRGVPRAQVPQSAQCMAP